MRKGDNKWTASTVAIDADTGKIAWGFQYTPWDCWDYDAVSTPLLADVALGDRGPVKALFHHDKNGFFYALDRTNGKFLYGEPIVPGINWAFGLDPETGRPNVNPDMIAVSGGPEVGPVIPSLEGGNRLAAARLQPGLPQYSTSCPTSGPWESSSGRRESSSRPRTASGIWAPTIRTI